MIEALISEKITKEDLALCWWLKRNKIISNILKIFWKFRDNYINS